jgi:hypothetical protein
VCSSDLPTIYLAVAGRIDRIVKKKK